MTDKATSTLTAPKQMKTIITLINLVKGELFITLDHAERCLEMFISERQSTASLQQFTQALQQIRGSLNLIEIKGATLLTDLMLEKTLTLSTDAPQNLDDTLSLLSTSIFKLRRYLDGLETYPDLLSELLIPAINDLRASKKLAPLPTSFFIDIIISYPPLAVPVSKIVDNESFGRLRQMYQIGLLGLIKEENIDASLRMMSRAIERLQKIMNQEQGVRLCIIVAAVLESYTDSKMTSYPFRKKLFRYVDQQLRDIQFDHKACNEALLKDLLYHILLDNALGIKALTVFADYNLTPLPYDNTLLEREMTKLIGPSHDAICSFTIAIREELAQTQQIIDSFTNEQDHKQLIDPILTNLKKLLKTLSLVNLHNAELMLKEQVGILQLNKDKDSLNPAILDKLAEVILHVESTVIQFESNACGDPIVQNIPSEISTNLYLKQGRELAIKEALSSIGTSQLNITAYVESKGDKHFLENMPQILDDVYGCLLFLNQTRAAKIIRQCSFYISQEMLLQDLVPETKQLDNLADILASLEFFIETGMQQSTNHESEVLDLAEESLITLNVSDFELPVAPTNISEPNKPTTKTENSASFSENEPLTIATEEILFSTDTLSTTIEELHSIEEEPIITEQETPLFLEEEPLLTTEHQPLSAKNDNQATAVNITQHTSDTQSTNEEAPKEISVETPKAKPKMTLSLEPITGAKNETTQEASNNAPPPKKEDKDDDITFTRPENWTLS